MSTKAGDVELRIPKLRKGSFFPSILEPRRRIDQALYAVVMEAYVHGVSEPPQVQYRKELRPVLRKGAETMDTLFRPGESGTS